MSRSFRTLLACASALSALSWASGPARADDIQLPYGITFGGELEVGGDINPANPSSGINFGQLSTDKANTFLLNQTLLTLQRQTDPKNGWDWGFKLQLQYGSDSRYTHIIGDFDHALPDRDQFDIAEASVSLHMPVLSAGGIDVKVGQYPTPLGYETIEPSGNPFYSHSYIANFIMPGKHTGGLAIFHATSILDIYAGLDTGVNTSLGAYDNNSAPAGIGGFQVTALGGKLTILALAHIGPETPTKVIPTADDFMREIGDLVVTYKATDKLTLTTEVGYVNDAYLKAEAWGIAPYASYTVNDNITLNLRGEIFDDEKGAFVAAYPGNEDFANALAGNPVTLIGAPPTTYGALTFGATIKPNLPWKFLSTAEIRPEIRYDTSLNGTKPYNGGKDTGQLTLASDLIIGF